MATVNARAVPASTGAAPEPAPEPTGEPPPLEVFVEIQVSSPPSFLAADVEPAAFGTFCV